MAKKDYTKKFDEPNTTHKIARLSKSKGSEIRLQIMEFPNKTTVDLRRFYKTEKMEKFAPTPKGLTIPVEDLPALYRAVAKALKVAVVKGLVEED